MNKDQAQIIMGLFAGMQVAIVHLSKVIARHANISPEDLAESFEATAKALPEEADGQMRKLSCLALNHLAAGIRGARGAPEWDATMKRLLH